LPPAATEPERQPRRAVALLHPLAAVVVALLACQLAFRAGAIYRPNDDHLLRLFPFDNRFDARVGIGVAAVIAVLVTVFARGKVGRWLRRGLGLVGLVAFAVGGYLLVRTIRNDCFRWEGCEFWKVPFFISDAVLLALASAWLLLMAGREPAARLRWFGAGAVVALALISAAWTYRATPVLHVYTGPDLARVRLQGFFETNQEFVPVEGEEPAAEPERIPPAIPALPMRGAIMICGGDWRVVKFPDHDRCLPRRPLVSIQPGDVEAIQVGIFRVGAVPRVLFVFTQEAGGRFSEALRQSANFHFVLLNGRGELIMDILAWPVPGPAISMGSDTSAADNDRYLRLILDQR